MKQFIKVFLISFLLFSVAFGAGLKWYLDREDEQKAEEVKEQKIEELEEKVKKERVNILLLGVDTLDGAKNQTRTDTMILFSMDPKTNTAFIFSIPRDSRVNIRNHGLDKINHAHAYGGVDLSIKAVKDLLQIPIHHYVRIDYQALFKMVDDLNGIEVDIKQKMYYKDPYAKPPLLINFKPGRQVLDGKQAMGYLRFRGYSGEPDVARAAVQQDFIQRVMKKLLSPSYISKVPTHIETLYTYVDTDMSLKDMLELAKDGIKLDPNKLRKMTVPGEGKYIGAISYFIVDEPKMREDIAYLLAADYRDVEAETENAQSQDEGEGAEVGKTEPEKSAENPEEKKPEEAKPEQPPAEEKPQTVIVQNGSGRNGVAKKASDLLKISDIKVNRVSNADNFNYANTLIYYGENRSFAESVQSALGAGQLVEDSQKLKTYKADIMVVIGKDFN